MALINCKECKKEVSSEAKTCPHCGAAPKKKTSLFTWLVAILAVGWMIGHFSEQKSSVKTSSRSTSSSAIQNNMPDKNSWSYQEDESKMDSSKTATMAIDANNKIQEWIGRSVPTLFIRCKENKTDVFVVTNTATQPEAGNYNKATVRLRYDDKKPVTQNWSESTDSKALFAGSAITVAKNLYNAKSFKFEFVPFNASPAIAEFNIDGIKEHLPKIAQTCGWKI